MATPAGTAEPSGPVPPSAPREPAAIDSAAIDTAVALARRWAASTETASSAHSARLAALVSDPAGLELAVRFIDRVARPEDTAVAGRELAALRPSALPPGVLGTADRLLFALGTRLGPVFPAIVVPAARRRLRELVGHLVADSERLGPHLAKARAEGYRLNLNLLGEAVLGEAEATARLMRIQTLAARRDVDHAGWLAWASADDERCWASVFGVEHDPAGLSVESNVLRYRLVEHLTILVGSGARAREVERVRAAADRAGVPVTVLDEAAAVAAIRGRRLSGRVRVVGSAPSLRPAVRADGAVGTIAVLDHPVLASARREMLSVLREQTVTRTRHRFGHPHF